MASCNSGSFGAFLGGALLGAAAALLLAPQRGDKTRREIKSRMHHLGHEVVAEAEEKADELMVEAEQAAAAVTSDN